MDAVDFAHHENPPTWAGVEPATLGTEGQRQTNYAPQLAKESSFKVKHQMLFKLLMRSNRINFKSKVPVGEVLESFPGLSSEELGCNLNKLLGEILENPILIISSLTAPLRSLTSKLSSENWRSSYYISCTSENF
ncbi:hypothetical protein TNCV_4989371 [Trichonephila clavipes]|uniref:Uncharacterized protein n=1 Tax=Trichonephila clavipes TaxID=2585209 RepID=A0A8X6WAN7_TRICX|nr:hypothetical protein TNCV_4989371 [Trichonephila clavipes]